MRGFTCQRNVSFSINNGTPTVRDRHMGISAERSFGCYTCDKIIPIKLKDEFFTGVQKET